MIVRTLLGALLRFLGRIVGSFDKVWYISKKGASSAVTFHSVWVHEIENESFYNFIAFAGVSQTIPFL